MPTMRLTNYGGIVSAIYAIGFGLGAHVAGTITPYASNQGKAYELPTPQQLDIAGYPFFAVRYPRDAGYMRNGRPGGADNARNAGGNEPVWDVDVYVLHPYSADFPNYDDAAADMAWLWQAYDANETLNGTVGTSWVAEKSPVYAEVGDQAGTRVPCTAAYVRIRCTEYLPRS